MRSYEFSAAFSLVRICLICLFYGLLSKLPARATVNTVGYLKKTKWREAMQSRISAIIRRVLNFMVSNRNRFVLVLALLVINTVSVMYGT